MRKLQTPTVHSLNARLLPPGFITERQSSLSFNDTKWSTSSVLLTCGECRRSSHYKFALGVVIPVARVLSDLGQDDENLASCLRLSASGSLSDTPARDQNSSAQRRSEPSSLSALVVSTNSYLNPPILTSPANLDRTKPLVYYSFQACAKRFCQSHHPSETC